MGWNTLHILREAPPSEGSWPRPLGLLRPLVSRRGNAPEDVAATADHPEPFAAMVWRDNLTACQFHPEKSQKLGLAMYANFAAG